MTSLLPHLAPTLSSLLSSLLFFLIAGHALADYSLQSESMARGKNPSEKMLPPIGVRHRVPRWYHWMAAHALIHGLVVAIILDPVFGVIETVLHFAIDCGKCSEVYGMNVDQTLHLACKLAYILLLVGMVS